jgi:hypothetical protein
MSNLPLLLPAFLCAAFGWFFAACIVADIEMRARYLWKNATACAVCFIGAGVALAAVVIP